MAEEIIIDGPDKVCLENYAEFTIVDPQYREYDWSVDGDSELDQIEPWLVKVRWFSPGTSKIIVINPEGIEAQKLIEITVPPGVPEIIGITNPFPNHTHTYYAHGYNPNNTLQWSTQNGTLISGQGTSVAKVRWDQGGSPKKVILTESTGAEDCSNNSSLTITRLSSGASFATNRTRLKNARIDRDIEQQLLYEYKESLAIRQAELQRILREDPNASTSNATQLQAEIDQLNADLDLQLKKVSVHNENAKLKHGELCSFSLTTSVINLSDNLPIIMFPVRLETKYKNGESGYQLKVRIYPDDIAIENHEKELTQQELDAGDDYWLEVAQTAVYDEKVGAWNALASKYGPQRAAWIALQTDPALPPGSEPGLKSSSWTRQPEARILPDKFVVTVYYAPALQTTYSKIGQVETSLIPDRIKVGIDPTDQNSIKSEGPEGDKVITLTGEAAWMQDFDEAVSIGMAVDIPLESLDTELTESQIENGYLKLIVAGVKVSEDEIRSKELLESNLNDHHYTDYGLGILKIGTPTSNSTKEASGFNNKDLGNLQSYKVEREGDLFTSNPDFKQRRDGQRLAEAFGISDSIFHHVVNSDSTDVMRALVMNTSMSALMLGAQMKDMWGNVFDINDINNTRKFFEENVTARGLLPTIRIGNQPYGVLPVTAYREWVWDENEPEFPFLDGLNSTLKKFNTIFEEQVPSVPTVNSSGGEGSAEEVLQALSQQPVSEHIFQKHAMGPETIYNTKSFYNELGEANSWYSSLKSSAISKKTALGLSEEGSVPKGLLLSYFEEEGKVKDALVQPGRLSKVDPIAPLSGEGMNYLEWVGTKTYSELKNESFGGGGDSRPTEILFDISKNTMLQEYWFAAHRLLTDIEVPVQWEAPEYIGVPDPGPVETGISSEDFLNGGEDPWSILEIVNENIHPELTIAEYLDSPESDGEQAKIKLVETKNSFLELAVQPAAEVDLLLRECLDLNSYRLDGWQLGMVNYRLQQMRYNGSTRVYGSYIGAYGYVEDLKPDLNRAYLDASELSQLGAEGPVERDLAGQGYIHAPSMNHASSAAVLKSAYDPIKDKELGNSHGYPRRINLNSGRVRKALKFIQGMNAGQDLSSLLGYEFERGLHETNDDVFIYLFRDAFPTQKLTESGGNPQSQVQAGNVVDGLKLYKVTRGESWSGVPYDYSGYVGSNPFPGEGMDGAARIEELLDLLAEIIDAIHDLALTEASYHLITGNQNAASGLMEAMEKGKPLPIDYEVLRTPINGTVFNQRLTLHLAPDDANANEWSADASPRSLAEPTLNAWVAQQIPDPSSILCKATIVGVNTSGDNINEQTNVSLGDLGIQPIDFISIVSKDLNNDESELSSRIRVFLKQEMQLSAGVSITIDYTDFVNDDTPTEAKSYYELLPFALKLQQVISGGRYLRPDDYLIGYDVDFSELQTSLGFDLSELETRVSNSITEMANLKSNFETTYNLVASDTDLSTNIPILRDQLIALANYGLQSTIPHHILENGETAKVEMLQIASVALANFITNYNEANNKWTNYSSPASNSLDDKELAVRTLDEIMQVVFGKEFRVIPLFKFYNPDELTLSVNDSSSILPSDNPLGVEEVITSISAVRNKVSSWDMARMLGESLYAREEEVIPIQIPYIPDDIWYALPHPGNPEMKEGKYSFIMHLPKNVTSYDVSGLQAGLMIDEWVENIPHDTVTTGLAYHKNQPGAKAPNCVLVAVTPETTGSWTWDHILKILEETFESAKRRAVDPDILGNSSMADLIYPVMFSHTGSENFSAYLTNP